MTMGESSLARKSHILSLVDTFYMSPGASKSPITMSRKSFRHKTARMSPGNSFIVDSSPFLNQLSSQTKRNSKPNPVNDNQLKVLAEEFNKQLNWNRSDLRLVFAFDSYTLL